MKKILITVPVLAAFALTGCSAGDPSAESTPSILESVAHSSSTDAAVEHRGESPELESWVAGEHAKWSDFYETQEGIGSTNSIFVASENNGGSWIRNIEWYAPAEGEIEITVEGNSWTEKDLRMISGYVFGILNRDDSGAYDSTIESVRTFSEDRSVSAVETIS